MNKLIECLLGIVFVVIGMVNMCISDKHPMLRLMTYSIGGIYIVFAIDFINAILK